MTLILKTDVVYTGTAKAKHLLELLQTPQDKLNYINKMLADINSSSDYPSIVNVVGLVDKLLLHIKTVQNLGAQALSINYTLKALIFIESNNLLYDDVVTVSPDFGVAYNKQTGIVDRLYGFGDTVFNSTGANLKLVKEDGFNSLTAAGAVGSSYVSSGKIFDKGYITGQCLNLKSSYLELPVSIRDNPDYTPVIRAELKIEPKASSVNVTINMPTVDPRQAGYTKLVVVQDLAAAKNNGFAAIFSYNTTNSSVYHNGTAIISGTESSNMFSLASKSVLPNIASSSLDEKLIEVWFINSSSATVAKNLSVHLNRQGG